MRVKKDFLSKHSYYVKQTKYFYDVFYQVSQVLCTQTMVSVPIALYDMSKVVLYTPYHNPQAQQWLHITPLFLCNIVQNRPLQGIESPFPKQINNYDAHYSPCHDGLLLEILNTNRNSNVSTFKIAPVIICY